jgi:2'-5' RNA ligase
MSETLVVDPYADHDRMENHWWWRPGWRVGTRFYAWHITLDDQTDLHRLMDEYATGLAPFPTLDPVPRRWRHITLQGLGHVEEVTDAQRDAAVEAVAARLASIEPIRSTYQRAAVLKEAIALPPNNPEAYSQLRNEIRLGIDAAWGHTPEKAEGFRAHTSVAYSNGTGDGSAIRRALDQDSRAPAPATVSGVHLILMHRDRRMYEWTTVATVRLG